MKSTKEKTKTLSPNLFPVVGIGASAGGLDAFKKLIKAIPENSGMAYVLVQHLDPKHESLLPSLLQKVTSLPVLEISDEIKVEPNHIYIIPSNKMLVANDGVLQLSPRTTNKNERNLPIDLFFTSLAEVHQSHSIGVVLSGTASDGTKGLKAIKDNGGITIAQNESAAYESMPHSAIQAGVVDFILSPAEIPQKLLEITKIINGNSASDENVPKEDSDIFNQILSLLRVRKGTDFTYYKQTTIRRRILRRMALNKNEDPAVYLKFLRENKPEQDILYQDLLIPVTSFFRDTKSFDNLYEKVFPSIIKNKSPHDPIRIWVAGCSTGQEVYSLAICLKEYLDHSGHPGKENVQVFATDISEPAIAKARTGIYTKTEVDGLTQQRLQDFFTKHNGGYQVNRSIRDMCVFAIHNFLKDPPFGKLDLISCRNVLIYMEPYLQKKALTIFHYALNNNGFLFLGKSETISTVSELFGVAYKGDKLFNRKDVAGKYMHVATLRKEQNITDLNAPAKTENLRTDFQKTADDIMLSKYTPAGVVVNEEMDIVHFRGKTGNYLEQLSGKPSHNLLKMAKDGLAFELRSILHKVKKGKKRVTKENISLNINDVLRNISIEAIPLSNTIQPYYLVLFHGNDLTDTRQQALITSKKKVAGKLKKDDKDLRIRQLEDELAQLREDMRSITEEQEAANEELQSANEELLSSSEELQSLNEELETGKEELQSTNEELTVVNQEMLSLNEQVTAARDYSQNIIANIRESLLVLDKNQRVITANKSFYKTFHVNEQQTEGVLIYDLGNKQWNIPSLRILLEKILPEKTVFNDFEVTHSFSDIGTRTMLLNARAVIGEKNQDKLILLSIEDITEKKRAQEVLNKNTSQLQQLVKELPAGVYYCDSQGLINFYNKAAANLWGREPEIGKEHWCGSWKIFKPDGSPVPLDKCPMAIAVKEGRAIMGEEIIIERPDGGRSNVLVYPQPEFGLSGEITGAINMVFDITGQVKSIKKIEESEHRYANMIYSSPLIIAILQGKDLILDIANDSILEHLGKGKDIIGKPYLVTNPELEEQGIGNILREVYRTGIPFQTFETPVYLIRNGKKESRYYNYLVQAQRKVDGEIEGIAIMATEVTPLVELNNKIKENEERFRYLVEQTLSPICIFKGEDMILEVANEPVFRIWNVGREALGKPFLEIVPEMRDQPFSNLLLDVFHNGVTHHGSEWPAYFVRENGEKENLFFNFVFQPYREADRTISGVFVFANDVTEQVIAKNKNQETQELREKLLEEKVQQRTGELSEANELLQEKNEELVKMNKELESFNYISSHDLQEPLRKIQTFANRIMAKEQTALSDKGKIDFSRIQDAASRMQQLIEDLLAYSRTNITEHKFEIIPLEDIVAETRKDLAEVISEKKAVIETGELVSANINSSQFRQVMNNLIANALKFSKPGVPPHILIQGKIDNGLQLQKENPGLTEDRLSSRKKYCHISISDNGIGFDMRYKDQIFEVFQRLYGKDEYPGTGIGLAIVKKIVENHNGIITARGEFDKGAIFDIYIPAW